MLITSYVRYSEGAPSIPARDTQGQARKASLSIEGWTKASTLYCRAIVCLSYIHHQNAAGLLVNNAILFFIFSFVSPTDVLTSTMFWLLSLRLAPTDSLQRGSLLEDYMI